MLTSSEAVTVIRFKMEPFKAFLFQTNLCSCLSKINYRKVTCRVLKFSARKGVTVVHLQLDCRFHLESTLYQSATAYSLTINPLSCRSVRALYELPSTSLPWTPECVCLYASRIYFRFSFRRRATLRSNA